MLPWRQNTAFMLSNLLSELDVSPGAGPHSTRIILCEATEQTAGRFASCAKGLAGLSAAVTSQSRKHEEGEGGQFIS